MLFFYITSTISFNLKEYFCYVNYSSCSSRAFCDSTHVSSCVSRRPFFLRLFSRCLDVWTRVFHLQAKTHFCFDLLVNPFHRASSSSSTTTRTTTSALNGPTEGDANCQTRLANLLYEWTDKATNYYFFFVVTSPHLLLESTCGTQSLSVIS